METLNKENQTKELTVKELEQLLEQKRKEERKERQQAKEQYIADRDVMVETLVYDAQTLQMLMMEFKRKSHYIIEQMREQAFEYGDIRSNSKGGFSLRSSKTGAQVKLIRKTKVEYDERARVGEQLIREVLTDMVKKRDRNAFELISSFLAKTPEGEFQPAMIANLLTHKDRYDDTRWQRGIELFTESHNTVFVSMSTEFSVKDEQGKDQPVSLTYASLPYTAEKPVITEE